MQMNKSTDELFNGFYHKIALLDKRLAQCEYILQEKDNTVSQISISNNIIEEYQS